MRKEKDLPYGRKKDDGSRRSGGREPDSGVGSARRAKRSSGSGSFRKVHGCVAYREEKVPVTLIKVASYLTLQEDLSRKWNQFVRTGFPKYFLEHLGD